jgi:hypothetical protein
MNWVSFTSIICGAIVGLSGVALAWYQDRMRGRRLFQIHVFQNQMEACKDISETFMSLHTAVRDYIRQHPQTPSLDFPTYIDDYRLAVRRAFRKYAGFVPGDLSLAAANSMMFLDRCETAAERGDPWPNCTTESDQSVMDWWDKQEILFVVALRSCLHVQQLSDQTARLIE